MRVAVFGSIKYRLSAADLRRIDAIISLRFTALVSDAEGADEQIQRHLVERGYRNVVVYHNGARGGGPRRNLGGWDTVLVPGSYTDKDIRMCADADAGLAFWNGRSRGTGRNVSQLRSEGKKVRMVSPGPSAPASQDTLVSALLADAGEIG
jgi:hypothetical protein